MKRKFVKYFGNNLTNLSIKLFQKIRIYILLSCRNLDHLDVFKSF
jgi:hypothetical protein